MAARTGPGPYAKPNVTNHVSLSDGRRLGYASYGDPAGVAVLHFHGWPGSHLDFAPNHEPAQRAGAQVIAVDRPGVGDSDFRAERRLADWPKDVTALVDALGIERFAVLGFSFGGPYAVAVAHALGHRVRALGLVSAMGPLDRPHATDGMMRPTRMMFALARTAGWLARPAVAGMTRSIARDPDRFVARMGRSVAAADRAVMHNRPDVAQAITDAAVAMCRTGTDAVLTDALAVVKPWNLRLEDVQVPTIVWQGADDANVPRHIGHHYGRAIPGAIVNLVEHEGHFVFYSHAADILTALTRPDTPR
jgi:pimeloyl-ACP methyl ester carboxylesterase